jgi:hypothetical protein
VFLRESAHTLVVFQAGYEAAQVLVAAAGVATAARGVCVAARHTAPVRSRSRVNAIPCRVVPVARNRAG